MVPDRHIDEWGHFRPWRDRDQIEQDLLLSRLMCEIANDELAGQELAFRGGTALHKLHMPSPGRYSEDLDYNRTTTGGIGPLLRRLTDLGENLGFSVSTKEGRDLSNLKFRYTSSTGTPKLVKIEINKVEAAPAIPLVHLKHQVQSSWWSGSAEIQTFQMPELVATKIRALYQRRKGRDIYDLWLAINHLGADPREIAWVFTLYRPSDGKKNWTPRSAQANLRDKLKRADFRNDLEPLVLEMPAGFNIANAAQQLLDDLILRVDKPGFARKPSSAG